MTAFESSGEVDSNGSSVTSLTFPSVVLTGANRGLVVWFGSRFTGVTGPTTITRGSDTFEKVREDSANAGGGTTDLALYVSTNEPQTASANLVCSGFSSSATCGLQYQSLTDLDQTTRYDNVTLNADQVCTGGITPMNVTSRSGDLVVDAVVGINGLTIGSPTGTGHTQRSASTFPSTSWAMKTGTTPGDTTVSIGWSITGSTDSALHVALNMRSATVATVPDAPTITTTPLSSTSIQVDITTVGDGGSAIIDTHVEYRVTSVGGAWTRVSTGVASITATLTGLAPDTQYDVRVIQENSVGESAPSATDTPTTLQVGDNFALSMLSWVRPYVAHAPINQATIDQATIQQLLWGVRDPLYTPPASPIILIVGNGVSIANSDATPSLDDHTDFGSVGIGQPVSRVFTIFNDGSGDLLLTGMPLVALSGAGAAAYTVEIEPGATIQPATSTTVTITFSPSGLGTFAASVSIDHNDVDEHPFTFAITGEGVAAGLLANAGPDQLIAAGSLVQLDGSGSENYTSNTWEFLLKPDGSLATLSSGTIINPTFLPDLPGAYTLRLTVYDAASPAESATDNIVITASELAAITPMFVAAYRPPTVPGNRRKAGVPVSTVLWKFPKDLYDVAVDWEEADVLPAGATSLSTLTVVVKDSGGNDVTVTLLASSGVEGFVSWAQLQAGTAGQVYDVILTQLFNNGQRLDRYVKVQVRNPRSYVVHAPFKYPSDKYPIPVEWAGRRPRGNPTLSTLITKAYDASDVDETSTYVAGSFVTGTIGAGYVIGGTGGESRLLEFAQEFSNGRKFHEYAMLTVEVPPA